MGPVTCLQVLGAKRKHLSGYSAATQGLHEGFIFGSEIIQVISLQSARVHMMLHSGCNVHDVICAACLASTHSPAATQGTPPAYRKKASRLVGGKCTLLARIDAYGQDPTGSSGASMKVRHSP